MRYLIILVLGSSIFLAGNKGVKADAYDDLVAAIEAYQEEGAVLSAFEAERKTYERLGDPYTINRQEALRIDNGISASKTQLAEKKRKYNAAYAAWQRALKPYRDLSELAHESLKLLRAKGTPASSELNRTRAIKTLENDISRLSSTRPDKIREGLKIIETMIRAGRPLSEVKYQVGEFIKNDPGANIPWGELIGEISKQFHGLQGAERVKAVDDVLKHLSLINKALTVLAPRPDDPLVNNEFKMLTDLVDIGSSLIPLKPVEWHMKLQKIMLEEIEKSVNDLIYQETRQNILALREQALLYADECGDNWPGLNSKHLFGVPWPNPKILLDKSFVTTDGVISGQWCGSSWYDTDGWVGLIPAEVNHGPETTGDSYDLDYVYMKTTNDRFTFAANVKPGYYNVRMYDDDDGGREVVSVRLAVAPEPVSCTADYVAPAASDVLRAGNTTYRRIPQKVAWPQASKACQNLRGKLVSIDSAHECGLLRPLIARCSGYGCWIGLTDSQQEGQWKWSDGSTPTFTNWYSGEPNDSSGDEDFAHAYPESGKWNDEGRPGGFGNMEFICEISR